MSRRRVASTREDGMYLRNIVRICREKKLDISAVCDHNAMENAHAVMKEASPRGITVLPGLEVRTREEVHMLYIFDDIAPARAMREHVYAHLPGKNRPEYFGAQTIIGANGEVLGELPHLLIGATTPGHTRRRGPNPCPWRAEHRLPRGPPRFRHHPPSGIHPGKPAHRRRGSLLPRASGPARKTIPGIGNRPCINSSDAHFPEDIGKCRTLFEMNTPTLEEIRMAIRCDDGRRMRWENQLIDQAGLIADFSGIKV